MAKYLQDLAYYWPEMLLALKETALMLTISLAAGLLLGLPLGTALFLRSKGNIYGNKKLAMLYNSYINITRSFPFLLFVIALAPLTRLLLGSAFGTYAAAFPLSLVAIALYARLVEQVLLDVPSEIIELAQSLGSSKFQLIVNFLYVEARAGLVLSLTSVLISLVSYSTIMGVIGGGGIGDFAIRYGYQRYETKIMYTTIFLMIVFVMSVQFLGSYVARKIDHRKK